MVKKKHIVGFKAKVPKANRLAALYVTVSLVVTFFDPNVPFWSADKKPKKSRKPELTKGEYLEDKG